MCVYTHHCAAAAKSHQSCPALFNPIDNSPPVSTVPGILQARTRGLPFPSPMHERGKWKWSRSVVSDSLGPHGLQPTRLLHPWDFPGKSTGVGCHCLLWYINTHIYIYIWSTQVWTEQVHIFLFNKYTLSQFILGCGTCRYGGPLWDLRILGFWYPQRWILEPVPCGYWRMIVTWSERNWLYYYLLLLSLDAPISYNRMRCISLLTS